MGHLFTSMESVKKASGLIATGAKHTIAVCADGTVLATGSNWHGQCNISDWRDVVSVAAGETASAGVRADGTVVVVGKGAGRIKRKVQNWRNITRVAVSDFRGVIGLKDDGIALLSDGWQWNNIASIGATWADFSGVSRRGTIINPDCPKPELGRAVLEWRNITSIASGCSHTIGLRINGTVMGSYLQEYYYGQCEVTNWHHIVAIAAGSDHSVGLRQDGRVYACGLNDCGQTNVAHWENIVAIAAYGRHTIGLRADGRVLATGENKHGQCNVSGWKLFDNFCDISSQYDISCFDSTDH